MIGYLIGNFPKLSETFVSREVANLKSEGIDVKVFSFGHQLKDITDLDNQIDYLTKSTVYLDQWRSVLFMLIRPLWVLRIFQETSNLAKVATNRPNMLMLLARAIHLAVCVRKTRISHIHVHWPYATMVAYLTSKLTKMSYSLSVHAHEVVHENGHFSTTIPNSTFVSFCNEAALQSVKETNGILTDNTSYHLCYHGVDCDMFAFRNSPPIKTELRLVTIGRITEQKGFDNLIRICSAVLNSGLKIHLTIVGGGSGESVLKELAHSLGFEKQLTITGWVPHESVREYIYDSHLFILTPPKSHQGLPNVVLEAMSCGRPVILSSLPTVNEVIAHDEGGWLLESGNYERKLNEIVGSCLTNSQVLEEKGAEARKIVEDKYSDQYHIKKLAKLLYEV